MIHTELNGSRVDILPVIKGLCSEYDRVRSSITDEYDAIAVSLSIEDIEILTHADPKELEYDPSDFDAVYAHFLKEFGTVDLPVPAYVAVTDVCKERDVKPIPLEMDDELFTETYCECIKIKDMMKEKRLLKKAMKKGFDMSSPEAFLKGWDEMANSIKGHCTLNYKREEHMAKELSALAKYKKRILAVIEFERVDGVLYELKRAEDVM